MPRALGSHFGVRRGHHLRQRCSTPDAGQYDLIGCGVLAEIDGKLVPLSPEDGDLPAKRIEGAVLELLLVRHSERPNRRFLPRRIGEEETLRVVEERVLVAYPSFQVGVAKGHLWPGIEFGA